MFKLSRNCQRYPFKMATGNYKGSKSDCIAIKLAMRMSYTKAGLAADLEFLLIVARQA